MARPKKAAKPSKAAEAPRVSASHEEAIHEAMLTGSGFVKVEHPKTVTLNGPMLLGDVQAALSDRYPHNDIHMLEGATIEVAVPGGVILVDFKAVNKCKNTAELRAYIDALPIQ